jgi:hypothetical protein
MILVAALVYKACLEFLTAERTEEIHAENAEEKLIQNNLVSTGR